MGCCRSIHLTTLPSSIPGPHSCRGLLRGDLSLSSTPLLRPLNLPVTGDCEDGGRGCGLGLLAPKPSFETSTYSFESGGTSFRLPPDAGGSGELSADSGSRWKPASSSTRENAPFCSPRCDSRPLLMAPGPTSLPRRVPMEDVGRPMDRSHDRRPSPRGTRSRGTCLRGSVAASRGPGVRGPERSSSARKSPRAESRPRAEGWAWGWGCTSGCSSI